MTRDSDIDLLIVKPAHDDRRDESVVIHDVLRGLSYPFDVTAIST